VLAYQIEDLPLWTKDGQHQNADLLIKCLASTIDAPSWQNSGSRASYDPKRHLLIVYANGKTKKQSTPFSRNYEHRQSLTRPRRRGAQGAICLKARDRVLPLRRGLRAGGMALGPSCGQSQQSSSRNNNGRSPFVLERRRSTNA
jgi:hypothetical protein